MSKLHDHGVDELFSDPQLFRALINQANCHLSIIDFRSGRYLYVNEMTCRSTGYTPREFLAMTVADIDPTVNRKWDAAKERLRRKKVKVFIGEGMIRRKDGSCFPVEVHSSVIRVGARDYLVATACDITERKKVLEALHAAREQLEQAVKERTAELETVNEALKEEIAIRARVEKVLKRSQAQLQKQKGYLERKSVAMGEMLRQIEWEKRRIRTNIASNAKQVLLPLLDRMRSVGGSGKEIALLKERVKDLTAEYGPVAAGEKTRLTPREMEIADMLRSGLGNKEIADLLNITLRSTEWHRYNIRKKLHLKGKRNNLRALLMRGDA
jgi:PAS domain S-box-containing protein